MTTSIAHVLVIKDNGTANAMEDPLSVFGYCKSRASPLTALLTLTVPSKVPSNFLEL